MAGSNLMSTRVRLVARSSVPSSFAFYALVIAVFALAGANRTAFAQREHPSHRSLQPDYQNMAQWKARIELLKRLGLISESATAEDVKRHPLLRPEFQRALNDLSPPQPGQPDSQLIERLKRYLDEQGESSPTTGTQFNKDNRPGQSPLNGLSTGDSRPGSDDRWNQRRSAARKNANPNRRRSGTFPSASESGSMADFLKESQKRANASGPESIDPSLSLTDRLNRITDRARMNSLNEGRGAGFGTGNGDSSSGYSSDFARVLENATRDAMKAMEGDSELQRRLARQAEAAQQRARRNGDGPSGFERLNRSADSWFSSFSGGADSSSFNGPSASAGGGASAVLILTLLGLALAGGGVWWVLQQRALLDAAADERERLLPSFPARIRSRADIVLAFHAMTARCPAVLADWWPHRRAAEALVLTKPTSQPSVDRLADLYELARYLPEDSELTVEQIEQARQALQGCRGS